MTERRLIEMLADGGVHSGRDLGESLGISRAAIWKQLQKLEDRGISVESVRGRGYRIPGGLDLLSHARITGLLHGEVRGAISRVEVHDELASTNSYLMEQRHSSDFHGLVCLAERQIQGRGRRGRSWVSPYGRNLYLSIGWNFENGAAVVEGLSLAVGVAARRAVVAATGSDACRLKWPNDILLGGKKLGGILVEMQGDPSDLCQLVIGVGLNVGMSGTDAAPIDQPWADVTEMGPVSRNRLTAGLLAQIIPLLAKFPATGFREYREEWQANDALRDQAVTVATPSRQIGGRAAGVADNGALQLEINGQVQEFSGGEISLRGAQ